jgi:hypothetical protein
MPTLPKPSQRTSLGRSNRPRAVLVALALAACARHQTPEPVPAPEPVRAPAPEPAPAPAAAPIAPRDTSTLVREYRGAYTSGFEMSWFEPCDAPLDDRIWWVTLTGEALEQRDSLLAKNKRPKTDGLAVRWRGTISPRMPAGHMGRGTRYMLVTEILDIRPLPSDGACMPGPKAS